MELKSFLARNAASVSMVALLGWPSMALAQVVIDNGQTVTVPGSQSSPWNIGGTLNVGSLDTGNLHISTGGSVLSNGAYLGSGTGSYGLVTVSGAGAQLINSGVFYVGNFGDGELTINDGGSVSSTTGQTYVGGQTTSTGIATVSGTGSSWTTNQLVVGLAGNGTLDILAGGLVISNGAVLGLALNGRGTVSVDGAGSQWDNFGNLAIYDGSTLSVQNGGLMNTGSISGQGTMSLDSGTLQAFSSNANFINFTGTGTFELLSGGGTIDSNGFDIGAASVISGAGALTKAGAGTLTLSAANTYSGATDVFAGTLQAGATDTFSANSAVNVGAAGRLDLSGFNQTVAELANAGQVSMGTNTAPGTVLTVNGNYVGNGGTIVFDTVLDVDSSPSDRMVVNGTTSGHTGVRVINAGGLGGLTTSNGIELVHVTNGAPASNGIFTLSNRVAAGAYEYLLFQGGVGAASTDGNWYLRSTLDCTLPGAAGMPACENGGSGEVPIYRSEVIVDTTIPALASRFGLGLLGTWHERTENEFATAAGASPSAAWGRIFGDTGRYGYGFNGNVGALSASFDQHGPSYDFSFGGLQAGMDLLRRDNGDGSRDMAGFYVGAGTASADVRSVLNLGHGSEVGKVSMDGYSLGGYYTHIAPSGWYVDAVLQGTYYDNVSGNSSNTNPQTLRTDGVGIIASLESSYPFELGNGFTFEPQGQLVYQHLSFNNGTDAFGRIGFNDTDAVFGRLSGRLSKDWTLEDGHKVTTWARAGLWTDFGSQAKTTFSALDGSNPTTLTTDLGGTIAQFDLGVSAQLSQNVSLFGVGNYSVAVNDADGHSFGGRVGIKVSW